MSRSTHNPLRSLKLLTRSVLVVGVLASAAAVVWAFRSRGEAHTVQQGFAALPQADESTQPAQTIDWSTFDVALWQPYPTAPNTADSSRIVNRQPPQVRLELLAISVDTDKNHSAILYDPSTHKVHRVEEGSIIDRQRVASIDAGGVEIESAGRIARLSLREESP